MGIELSVDYVQKKKIMGLKLIVDLKKKKKYGFGANCRIEKKKK